MGEIDKDGMPGNAMWIQCTIVCVMILLISFGGDTMQQFFLILTAMVNVGMTVPYMFISYAFPKFKKMKDVDRSFFAEQSPSDGGKGLFVIIPIIVRTLMQIVAFVCFIRLIYALFVFIMR